VRHKTTVRDKIPEPDRPRCGETEDKQRTDKMKTMMAKTLMKANQYSNSPNHPT